MRLLGSIGSRIVATAALAAIAALLLGGLLLHSSHRSREAFSWVNHTQQVLLGLDALQRTLGEAESGLRGFLLTRDETYLNGFDDAVAQAADRSSRVTAMVADNQPQEERAVKLAAYTSEKIAVMRQQIEHVRNGPPGTLPDIHIRDRGRMLMSAVAATATTMRNEERHLLSIRTIAAENQVNRVRALVSFGSPLLVVIIAAVAWLIRNSIVRPLNDLLDVVSRFGAGDREARARTRVASAEFKRLAYAYNNMADRLVDAMEQQGRAEDQLARVNAELVERGLMLEARQHSIELLSEMSHRLQAIHNEGELQEVLDCFLPQVLPNLAGALYVHNHSRNMLMRLSVWNGPQAAPEMFAPSECWGLRRGKLHEVETPGADLVCVHAAGHLAVERICQPVLAGGEVLGLLYAEGQLPDEYRFRLGLLMENVALALVNENLRSRLREQSIRDPLTKLFNRRYMEEALALETARAERSGADLSVIMCDVDHFKRFNDGNGHPAGDALLAAVAALIQSHFRHGDIVCRYGGEEFTVIAPGASRSLIYERADSLRQAVRELLIDHQGRQLGPVTMSFGVDTWTADDTRGASSLVSGADRALFRAKRLGRDRVEVASSTELAEAAE